MEQQTAVEWLMSEVCVRLNMDLEWREKTYEQAKEMEKQRLEQFYKYGLNDGYNDTFEQHYNETFKNK